LLVFQIIAGTHIINHFKLFSDFRVKPWSLFKIIPIDFKRKTFVRISQTISLHIAHCRGDNMKNSQDIIKQRNGSKKTSAILGSTVVKLQRRLPNARIV